MTHLSLDALTLSHVAITLVAIASGFIVLAQMLKSRLAGGVTGIFWITTVLTSVTGFVFFQPPNPPTPAQLTGIVAMVIAAPTLFALYVKHLVAGWRRIYVIGTAISLYLNVFVAIIQAFQKVPSPFQPMEGAPPGGPVFGAVQGLVLVGFVLAGWQGLKTFYPAGE